MQLTHHHHSEPADGLLALIWKIMAGLAVAVGTIFLGTVVVEATLPQLPHQARASLPRPTTDASVNGLLSRAAEPVRVDHFHAQFALQPGGDTAPQPDAF